MTKQSILIDTSVLIDYLRSNQKATSDFYRILKSGHTCYISMITHTELYAGKSIWTHKKAREELDTIMKFLEVVVCEEKISMLAGKIRATSNIFIPDAVVAATALYYDLPIATKNLKDFEKVEGLKLWNKEI